jgi:lipopolysaccharide transport system ATP-binding protein
VLFVSHNLSAIQALCARAICLENGSVAVAGSVNDCIACYTRKGGSSANEAQVDLKIVGREREGDGQARLTRLEITRGDGNASAAFAMGESLVLKFSLVAHQRLRDFVLGFSIDTLEERVLICSNHHDSLPRGPLPAGEHTFEVRIEDVYLAPGTYALTAAITPGDHPGVHDIARNCARFTIEPRHSEVTAQNRYYLDERPGFLRCAMDWRKC